MLAALRWGLHFGLWRLKEHSPTAERPPGPGWLLVGPLRGRCSGSVPVGWGEPLLGWPSSAVTPVLSPGPEEGAAPGLGLADWQGSCPCSSGLRRCLSRPLHRHVDCCWPCWLLRSCRCCLPAVTLPPAREEGVAPCAPVFPLFDPDCPGPVAGYAAAVVAPLATSVSAFACNPTAAASGPGAALTGAESACASAARTVAAAATAVVANAASGSSPGANATSDAATAT